MKKENDLVQRIKEYEKETKKEELKAPARSKLRNHYKKHRLVLGTIRKALENEKD